MYEAHPAFESPPPEAEVWRYMDFTKFVSLLDRGALFFARADRLGDPFEGSYSAVNAALRPHLYGGSLEPGEIAGFGRAMSNLRRFRLVNCWHENAFESEAMWRLYSGERQGIAVKTTFGSLAASLTGREAVHIGRMKYVDFRSTFIPEDNAMAALLHKRKSFEHEREVRAIHTSLPPSDNALPLTLLPDVCETGLYLEIDLHELIQEVVIDPYADDWFVELTQSMARTFRLDAPVRRSALAGSPVW